jgi:protein transport protein SEC23
MKELIEATGGYMVLGDSYGQSVFKESLRYMDPNQSNDPNTPENNVPATIPENYNALQMAFHTSLEILTSSECKVSGIIGPVTSLSKHSSNVSNLEIGVGGTNLWGLGGVNPNTTLAGYCDITNPGNTTLPDNKRCYQQFVTKYQHANGRTRVRSTTICGMWY